ncbi:hypothetical protein BST27_11630 [Mycobacterium intermedium]|uniref:Uncharacterized protein n=1 Tax=Mycobacterium intermedium TaxID=28445 RepID=A0A1E3SAX0_MYCIE|nr:hypothetical protein [Mycobacterium intermedium]MCV6967382.1 hypothetical protein [Mycobacterium intermedium]ODQ99234.1 hypothetical protein BHQ20_18120 [Mycobacterium intermedium]OPE49179.1 hypothetical protein BV508_15105 [Mycobacterium intermedium]ORB05918.1 hypothetical protein BST27_11630 [Mycobacterium intermedium]
MFVIKLVDGDEIKGDYEELSVNEQTGVLTVRRLEGFDETITHYSPSSWRSVTQRTRGSAARPSLVSSAR